MESGRFEWDDLKAAATLARRGVSFEDAATVFDDPLQIEIPDLRKDYGEIRSKLVGRAAAGPVLAVIFTERGGRVRIISVRRATRKERRSYGQSAGS